MPEGFVTQALEFAGLQGQSLQKELPRQALARVAVGTGAGRAQLAGELFIEAISAAVGGVGQRRLQGVVGVEALKDEIPEGDDGSKEPLIKGLGFEGWQAAEAATGQELDKEAQETGRGESRRRRSYFGAGRFLGSLVVCIY